MSADLVQRISQRAHQPTTIHDMSDTPWAEVRFGARLQPEVLAHIEHTLGMALPPLLKQIYLEIGNGGFGPGYGLLRAYRTRRQNSLLEVIERFNQRAADQHCIWPKGIIPLCTWGCGIYSFVDCEDAAFPVVVYDGNQYLSIDRDGTPKLTTGSGRELPLHRPDRNVQLMPEFDPTTDFRPYPLIAHRATFEGWISAWADGVNLWTEMGL